MQPAHVDSTIVHQHYPPALQVALLQSARPALAQIFSVADSLRRSRLSYLLMGNATARCVHMRVADHCLTDEPKLMSSCLRSDDILAIREP